MATTRTFQDMLNQYLPNDLLMTELVKRDFVLSKATVDNGWKGGSLIVPFEGAGASSVAFGSLTASNDIAEDVFVRGSVSTQKEAWGSMIFNHRDLMEHDSSMSEKSFLKILPGRVDRFLDGFKNKVSTNLLIGNAFAKLTADGDASGNLTTDRPDLFDIGQKVSVDDDDSSPVTGYVRTIVMDTGVVTLYDARSGGSVVNLSGYAVSQNAKVYHDGGQSNGFDSLKSQLLSSTNGGGTTIAGQTKTAYPFLQAINVDGAAVSATNIMEKIFDALTSIRQKGKGRPNDVVMSYRNFGWCLKIIEASKGSFNVKPGSQAASQYGWTEVEVGSVTGVPVKLIAVQEMSDSEIMFIDWRAVKFYTNGGFRKRTAPDGKQYFESRATTGYTYILDMCLFGELILQIPCYCGIMYGIV